MPKRSAQGAGSIRQRSDGRWEARFTVGRNPGTGRQIQKSVYGASQKEVLQKLHQIQNDLSEGSYVEPSKMTVSGWFDIWVSEYLGGVKQSTQASYSAHVRNHIKPEMGKIALQKLRPHHIQALYNKLQSGGTSPKTIKNLHGVMHSALEQAAKLGYLKNNPSDACALPRVTKKEVKVIPDDKVGEFLNHIVGSRYEAVFYVDLFTGMRQGEILGLTWDCVDFKSGTILINKQLVKEKKKHGEYFLDTTKYDKVRKLKPANLVMVKLKEQKLKQTADRLRAGAEWKNHWNLVFTDEMGKHMAHVTVLKHYKKIVAEMGMPDLTFHAMRHSYAVISLINGDDIKTVQENLGHHTAAFTLDTYAHVTEKMQEDSARRMEQFIKSTKKA